MKSKRPLYELAEERVLPGGDQGHFAWHVARYRFALPRVAGKRVLDLGCGEGYGTALLAETAREVVGVDYSPVAIDHARRSYARENVRFVVADATALDDSLGHFDVVTCFEVVEHVERDDRLFAGVARVLRPGGTLVLSTPNRLVDELVESIGGGHFEYHVNVLTPADLRRRARPLFDDLALYGQSVRKSPVHTLLKAADVFNVRHRVVRSLTAQHAVAAALTPRRHGGGSPSFRFSRLLVRQSPIVVLVARKGTREQEA
ncbi:MAG TPA: class I SAM-dependent methyltransferase [Gaiellaceae bacterium]|jgi:SAM-dependent methyltransferase|nr:class I SAM-dependent methyltransferase [Gaiellaceae bacterium]